MRPLGFGPAVSCRLSQCSTIFPFSNRKMSKPIFGPKKLYSVCANTKVAVLQHAPGVDPRRSFGSCCSSAPNPASPSATARLCWMYFCGLMTATGSGAPVSIDFRRSTTCCFWLDIGIGSAETGMPPM